MAQAMHVDQHIDAVVCNALRGLSIIQALDADKYIKGIDQARAMRGTVFGAVVEGVNVKSRSVVGFDQVGHDQAHCVGA